MCRGLDLIGDFVELVLAACDEVEVITALCEAVGVDVADSCGSASDKCSTFADRVGHRGLLFSTARSRPSIHMSRPVGLEIQENCRELRRVVGLTDMPRALLRFALSL